MGKEQLPQLVIDHFMLAVVHRQGHIAQGQPLHGGAVGIVAGQRHQRTPRRQDRVSRLPRQAITVSRTARGGIGHAARGHNHGARLIAFHSTLYSCRVTVPDHQRLRSVPRHTDMQPLQLPLQRAADVKGTVAHRIDPLAALHLQRNTQFLKKSHGVPAVPAGKDAIKEFPVTRHMGNQLVTGTVIGHIAAALTRNVELFSEPLVGLKQLNRRA